MSDADISDTSDDGRNIAATIFDGAAAGAGHIAALIPDPVAKGALLISASLAKVIGAWIRSMGTTGAERLIAELTERRDEGVITDDNLRSDDASIAKAVSDMYKDEGEESDTGSEWLE